MKKIPTVKFVYNRRGTASLNKKASIELRITCNRKQVYISSGISVYPKQWKNGFITDVPDAKQLNAYLDSLLGKVRQIIVNMVEEGTINLNAILPLLEKSNIQTTGFIAYCRKRAEIRKYGKTEDSKKRYDRFIRLFSKWGKIKTFEDITEEMVVKYDVYLSQKGLKPYSKWNNYHRFLNSFILDAIEAGYISKNPYRNLCIEKDKSNGGLGKYLTEKQLEQIKNTKMPTESLERVKDLFLFQTYTCLSYTDLKNFKPSSIQTIKGKQVYIGCRKKTDKPFTIPLLKEAIAILEKYNYNLPILSNVKYNLYLKAVAQNAGINKPVSSHWARHTGATILLNHGVSMQVVSKICGHSSIKITEQAYAKLLDETVVDAVAQAFE